MKSFWKDQPDIVAHLEQVNHIINQQLTVKQSKMNEILKDLAHSGGKKIRPGLCIIGG